MDSLSKEEGYSFIRPGTEGRRNVIDDPDHVWVNYGDAMGKITVELKSPWAVVSLDDLRKAYSDEEYVEYNMDGKGDKGKHKIIRAVKQVYVYMTLNKHRFGAITTFNETVFFKR